MSKTLAGVLVAVTAVIGLASTAKADVLYINSDGSMNNISDDVMLDRTIVSPAVVPTTTTQVITQPAVIETTPVITTPVVQPYPVLLERPRRHLLHFGIGDLFNFRLF